MSGTFNYDWFTGPGFEQQKHQARLRCARKKFPTVAPDQADCHPDVRKFLSELEVRTLIYLRDGFSYEMKELVDAGVRSFLTFECESVDEQYKVGSFVVALLFDEIVRIEVFAVHPSEKPEDMPHITGFRSGHRESNPSRDEPREPPDAR